MAAMSAEANIGAIVPMSRDSKMRLHDVPKSYNSLSFRHSTAVLRVPAEDAAVVKDI